MSKRDDERERERSARKKAEIDAEVNANKAIVYDYVAARKDVTGKQCVEELGMFEKGKRYLEWLSLNGHLSRMKRTIDGKRLYVYNAINPYVNPTANVVLKEPTKADTLVRNATRAIRLLDREQVPQHKTERPKGSSGVKSSMQSSMRMFGNW